MNHLLAIDPGNIDTAYALIDQSCRRPLQIDKTSNETVLKYLKILEPMEIVIEMVACYGMPVGKEVFDTCVWIGCFKEAAITKGHTVSFVYREDVKLNLCNSKKAKDPHVRQALIDRFAFHDLKNGKGTKKKPDWFYGFHADIWAAYAVGITFIDAKEVAAHGRQSNR